MLRTGSIVLLAGSALGDNLPGIVFSAWVDPTASGGPTNWPITGSAIPAECQAGIGVEVPATCCSGASVPVVTIPGIPYDPGSTNGDTCRFVSALGDYGPVPLDTNGNQIIVDPATGVPNIFGPPNFNNIASKFYLNCEAGNVPTWAEFCEPTWSIPTPTTCNNLCTEVTSSFSAPTTAETCGSGCRTIVRGAGCYPIRYPAEVGNYMDTTQPTGGYDSVTGSYMPSPPPAYDPVTVEGMRTFPIRFFLTIPTCTSPYTSASGDPHLKFAHGGKADFRGEPNTYFNMLSHQNISMNVKTVAADFHWKSRLIHGTKMANAYWTLRTPSNTTIFVEYQASEPGRAFVTTRDAKGEAEITKLELKGAGKVTKFSLESVSVELLPERAVVVTLANKWETKAKATSFPFAKMNGNQTLIDINIAPLYDADHDKIAPHGIIGQSYDGDDVGIDGKLDARTESESTTTAQAEGAIEGHYTDYKMSTAFATDFKYSRFVAVNPVAPRDTSKLAGKKHAGTGHIKHAGASDVPTATTVESA